MSKREQKLVIVPANEHHGVYIEDEITGRTVCDFYFMKGEKVVPFHDAEANAQKLVASLDMLEALEGAATWLESWQSAEPYLSTIKAAISKAAGGGV